MINSSAPLLFALASSRAFAESIARRLGIELAGIEERAFEDGEHKTRPLASVRGRDVFVIQSLYADHEQSVNDKFMRLLFFIATLRDAGAARITLVAPMLCYARKDRRSQPRDPVTTRYVATLIEAMGADQVVTLDVHNLAAFQNAFHCGTEHLEAVNLFVEHFVPRLGNEEVVVVAPDAGGIKRAERFRERLARALDRPVAAAFAEKHRALGMVSGDLIVGDIEGRTAIILDDLISTGTTLARTAQQCLRHGATRVIAAATHGLFVGAADAVLADSAIEQIVVTDAVPAFRLTSSAARAKLVVLGTAELFAAAIARLHSDGSIVDLLQAPS